MNKLMIGLGCAAVLCPAAFGEEAVAAATATPETAAPAAATATAAPTAAAPVAATTELKVEPGAVLMVWAGKDTSEAEIAAMVDKGPKFDAQNGNTDPAVRSTGEITCRWSGILNVSVPGIYTFNLTSDLRWSESRAFVFINGVQVFEMTDRTGSRAKNVQLPGPANIEIVIYAPSHNQARHSLMLRYKKAGTLAYATLTPEALFHGVE